MGGPLPPAEVLPEDAVLLHIGVHKTGTTAIQAALADAREELASLGVRYPGKLQAQHRAAQAGHRDHQADLLAREIQRFRDVRAQRAEQRPHHEAEV